MRAGDIKNFGDSGWGEPVLKFFEDVGIERRVIEQKQLRLFPRWYAGLAFLDPPLHLPSCGKSQVRGAGCEAFRTASSNRVPNLLCSVLQSFHRLETAPMRRSHSSKLPRKPSSQAVLKLKRALISRRFPPFVSLTFR